jgi:hypothetical protein
MDRSYRMVVSVTLIAATWAGCQSASASSPRAGSDQMRLASESSPPPRGEKPPRSKAQAEQSPSAAQPSASAADGQSISLPARIPIVEEELRIGTARWKGARCASP